MLKSPHRRRSIDQQTNLHTRTYVATCIIKKKTAVRSQIAVAVAADTLNRFQRPIHHRDGRHRFDHWCIRIYWVRFGSETSEMFVSRFRRFPLTRLVIFGHRRSHPPLLYQYSWCRRLTANHRTSLWPSLIRGLVSVLNPLISTTGQIVSIFLLILPEILPMVPPLPQKSPCTSPYLPHRPSMLSLPLVAPPYVPNVSFFWGLTQSANAFGPETHNISTLRCGPTDLPFWYIFDDGRQQLPKVCCNPRFIEWDEFDLNVLFDTFGAEWASLEVERYTFPNSHCSPIFCYAFPTSLREMAISWLLFVWFGRFKIPCPWYDTPMDAYGVGCAIWARDCICTCMCIYFFLMINFIQKRAHSPCYAVIVRIDRKCTANLSCTEVLAPHLRASIFLLLVNHFTRLFPCFQRWLSSGILVSCVTVPNQPVRYIHVW